MNRATRRAAARGREVRFTKKGPATLLFAAEIQDMLAAEHAAVMAFRGGWADACHFDMLLECMMMMQFAANDDGRVSPEMNALNACEFATVALLNIRDRYDGKGKLGATGDELRALDLLVETSADFWPRQASTIYCRAWKKTGEWKQSAVEQAKAKAA